MILSALLTSVAINLAISILYFVLYSVLRQQPGYVYVYAPRAVAEGKAQQKHKGKYKKDFDLERFLPSAGWLRTAWSPSEDELLETAGLDGVVFMRIFIFSMKMFAFASVIGLLVLVPVNYMGDQLSFDFTDWQSKTLETYTISNMVDGSNRLWIHFSAVYIFTLFVCCLLYFEYKYISAKRLACFFASKNQPQHFTILVRGIPITRGKTVSDSVESFFSEYYPSTYLSHCVVHRTSKLKTLKSEAHKVYGKVVNLRSSKHEKRFKREGFMGLTGQKVDLLDQYQKQLVDIERNMQTEKSSNTTKEVRSAFVSFKTRLGAAVALRIRQGEDPTDWITERAPDPKDVHWAFFSSTFTRRWISTITVFGTCAVLTILFFIPVLLVQGLTHLDQLEHIFPFLKDILEIRFVGQIVTGYLPSLVLQIFLHFVPSIMLMLSSVQGYIAQSQIEKSATIKVLLFTIWNVYFANVLSGSALYRVDVLLEPKKIPHLLGVALPGQATFFIAYVVTSGWTGTSLELFQLRRLVPFLMKKALHKVFGGNDDFEVPAIRYHKEIPGMLFFGLLGITYFFLAPLILPFLLVFYFLAYIIYRHQILHVYAPKFETGGKFWPLVHNATIFSLVLMHIVAIGIFGLKKLPLASYLIVPLPIITLIFHNYCQRRFVPTFKDFSAETLIKKDIGDQKDRGLSAFYRELENAYRDPAMAPLQFSRSDGSIHYPSIDDDDSIHSPLLR